MDQDKFWVRIPRPGDAITRFATRCLSCGATHAEPNFELLHQWQEQHVCPTPKED